MKKSLTTVLLFGAIVWSAMAQILVVDSLQIKLQHEKSDTSRVMLYNQIARLMANTARLTSVSDRVKHYTTALQYADSGLLLASNTFFRRGEAELSRTCGAMYYYLNEYDTALSYYDTALEISSELNDEYGKAATIYNIAIIYQSQGKRVQALKNYLIAASQMEKLGKKSQLQMINSNISNVYKEIEEFDLSIDHARKSISVALELNDSLNAASLYDIIASSYLFVHDTIKGIEAYEKSIELYRLKKEARSEARVLHNYAVAVKSLPLIKRKRLLNRSRKLMEQYDPEHENLAYVYMELSTMCGHDSTEYFQDKALKQALLSGQDPTISVIYIKLGDTVLANGQFGKAETYYLAAREANKQVGSANIDRSVYAGLAKVYQQQGDYKKAFEVEQQAIRMQDSIAADENRKRLEVLRMQYELKEQLERQEVEWKAQVDQQQQIFERRRKVITYTLIVMGLLSALLVKIIFNRRRTKHNNITLREQHEEILQIQEELRQSNDELNMYKEYLEEMVHKQVVEQEDKNRQLRNISNNLPGGFIYRKVVEANGREYLSYVSNTVEQLVGVPAEQLIKTTGDLFSFTGDDAFIKENKVKEEECNRTMQPFTFEFCFVKNGKSIWLYNHSLSHPGESGSTVWDGFVIDITRQKEEEKSLKAAKEKAEEADRLKSVFLSNMSHEIRTPMNAILGFIGFVEREDLPVDKRHEYIKIIQDSVNQLLQLIGNIIDISKLEVQQIVIYPTQFPLNKLMDEIERAWSENIHDEKMLQIICDDSHFIEPDIIFNDRERINQVLCNLINNAIKYTDKGFIRFGYEQADDPSELLFFVEDTGIGIPQYQRNIIFEHFRQGVHTELKPKYGGTGLGLSISKGLVERMGGRIWVESTEGLGSTFYFTIKKKIEE